MRGYWFITFFVGIQLLPLIIPLNNSPEKKTALKFLTKHVFKKFYIVENAWGGGWEELSRFCILIICFWGFFVHCILCRSVQSLCFWESYKMTHTVTSESPHYNTDLLQQHKAQGVDICILMRQLNWVQLVQRRYFCTRILKIIWFMPYMIYYCL